MTRFLSSEMCMVTGNPKRNDHAHTSDFEVDVDAEFRRYNSISSVDLQQPDAVILYCGGDNNHTISNFKLFSPTTISDTSFKCRI